MCQGFLGRLRNRIENHFRVVDRDERFHGGSGNISRGDKRLIGRLMSRGGWPIDGCE